MLFFASKALSLIFSKFLPIIDSLYFQQAVNYYFFWCGGELTNLENISFSINTSAMSSSETDDVNILHNDLTLFVRTLDKDRKGSQG